MRASLHRPISLANREASGSLTLIPASLKRAPVAAYPASAGECFAGPRARGGTAGGHRDCRPEHGEQGSYALEHIFCFRFLHR